MAGEEPIIALFDDRAQALRLCNELRSAAIPERAITHIAALSDRRDAVEKLVQTGIARSDAALFADEVCGGATLLAVCPTPAERARVAEIIARHAPANPGRAQAVTESIPGDARSGERVPEVTPMPTGSGSFEPRAAPAEEDER
jgi:hypothetical protein